MTAPFPGTAFDVRERSAILLPLPAAGLPDDGIINRSDPAAMRAWSRLFGVHQPRILIAVAVVGPRHDAVRDYLQNSRTWFGPED
ncbi:DUF3606 domain-containing protein [Sphingopyxis sp.]|uniref:DUF3606 domain-containing protein n=1 Tax=Sphingopyxis sp. TaxID=1908224 RepID=UPI003BAA0A85